MKLDTIINLDDQSQKRKLMTQIGSSDGPHEITIKPWKPRRSNNQNRWYFKCVVGALCDYESAQGNDIDYEAAHDCIARAVNGDTPIVNRKTGEIVGSVRKPTRFKDKAEFSEYIEKAIAWLSQMGIEIPTM